MTQCVLKWLWLSSHSERNPGQIFAKKAFYIENAFEKVALDEDEFTGFFIRLPDGVCREIYEFLKEGNHHMNLDNTHSAWHHINHNYEERFDTGNYLESCLKYLDENWRYGRPLVDEALKQNDFKRLNLSSSKPSQVIWKGMGEESGTRRHRYSSWRKAPMLIRMMKKLLHY